MEKYIKDSGQMDFKMEQDYLPTLMVVLIKGYGVKEKGLNG